MYSKTAVRAWLSVSSVEGLTSSVDEALGHSVVPGPAMNGLETGAPRYGSRWRIKRCSLEDIALFPQDAVPPALHC